MHGPSPVGDLWVTMELAEAPVVKISAAETKPRSKRRIHKVTDYAKPTIRATLNSSARTDGD